MKKKKLTDAEIEELDNYLQRKFNYDTYEELCDDDYGIWKDLFEPLEFFRLFYSQIEFIEQNKAKPLFVSRNLKELSLTDKQLDFLYFKFERYFDGNKKTDEQLKICCREISRLRMALYIDEADENEVDESTNELYRFKNVLAHLETLPAYREKIAYLIQEKTKYEQDSDSWLLSWEKHFGKQCQLEMNKLSDLERLKPKQVVINTEPEAKTKKHKDLTLDRATLLLNYLLTYEKANCHNTKKAEVISFLTGYSANTIGDKLSALHSKADDNFVNYEKDMKIVRKYFESLGLSEIVEMIDRDLKI